MGRGGAKESERQAVWVVRDLHNPEGEKTSKSSVLSVCVCVFVSSLLRLGSDQQSQGAPHTKGLADHGFHLRDGSEEQQVLIDGVNLPADLQASHLGGTDTHTDSVGFCI